MVKKRIRLPNEDDEDVIGPKDDPCLEKEDNSTNKLKIENKVNVFEINPNRACLSSEIEAQKINEFFKSINNDSIDDSKSETKVIDLIDSDQDDDIVNVDDESDDDGIIFEKYVEPSSRRRSKKIEAKTSRASKSTRSKNNVPKSLPQEKADDSNTPSSNENICDFEQFVDVRPIRLMIKRFDQIAQFSLLRTSPISSIYEDVSKRFDIPVPNIILYLNDTIVDGRLSPKSLNLSVADILEVLCRKAEKQPFSSSSLSSSSNGIETKEFNGGDEIISKSLKDDPNFIQINFRDSKNKSSSCVINRFETVSKLAQLYCKVNKLEAVIEKIQLKFDSETMPFDKRIDSFEIENGDQIDVILAE
ncbi:hypothetical protein SSS_02719 [Sarcoptes scabiei]|uniref:Rad60/SUMO-like domain-containing protein n=1 Tax=Sarcoptes scabiei TaxID=52283 RepID=A0A834R9J6_SARSC|nr:hypothetical protein SSS_02719 [Sarcoptes scabiei]